MMYIIEFKDNFGNVQQVQHVNFHKAVCMMFINKTTEHKS